jgi:Leucine-rich repeat (LRR) protein
MLLIFAVVAAYARQTRATTTCTGNISTNEYAALQLLYAATDGVSWAYPAVTNPYAGAEWYFPSDVSTPCGNVSWDGLTCSRSLDLEATCTVTALELAYHNLDGTLPSSVSLLQNLYVLDLSHNVLRSTIPAAIGNFTAIKSLILSDNKLGKGVPAAITSLSRLNYLDLGNNYLTGSILSQFGYMTELQHLLLGKNYLKGTLPSGLFEMTQLIELVLDYNSLTGSLPDEFGSLTNLQILMMYNNYLTGGFPRAFGNMSELQSLGMYYNSISGTIPTEIGQLKNLSFFNMETNLLSSSLPTNLFGIAGMQQLVLDSNFFSVTLCSQIGQLTDLEELEVADNILSGHLPSELANLNQSLRVSFLAGNLFSGQFPTVLTSLTSLIYLYLNQNLLSGTLSSSFGDLRNLEMVNLAHNSFTGLIPSSLWTLTTITEISIGANAFSGTLSHAIQNMTRLNLFNGALNLFTGHFPSEVGLMGIIRSLDIHSNYFTGRLGLMSSKSDRIIESIDIGTNFFSGSIPSEFAGIGSLQNVNASMNLLVGSIDALISNGSYWMNLEYLDLSTNSLSGTIPAALFRADSVHQSIKPLTAVILYSNCFTGPLPAAICDAKNLSVLVLDSVSSAPACDVRFPPWLQPLFKVVIGKQSLTGNIPNCIWSMPNLETLHLSGNGLTGALADIYPTNAALSPDNISTGSALKDVSLASNTLTGTLPLSWQQWPWHSLDISGNKITGTLSEEFAESNNCTNMDLSVNRLSGNIPKALQTAQQVNILNGNLFQCRGTGSVSGESRVPANDPNNNEYVCGSDALNDALVLFVTILFGTVTLCGYRFRAYLRQWMDKFRDLDVKANAKTLPKVYYVRSFLLYLRNVWRLCVVLTVLYVCGAMVIFMILKLGASSTVYSTHTLQYGWVTTSSYLHGAVPVGVLVVFVFLSKLCIAYILSANIIAQPKPKSVKALDRSQLHTANFLQTCTKNLRVFMIISLHVVVLIVVNVGYVYFLITGLSTNALFLLQISLSVFKLAWNVVYINNSLARFTQVDNDVAVICSSFMQLFTFIASPVIATFMSDTTCFRYFITGQPSVLSTFPSAVYDCILYCDVVCFSLCEFSDYDAATCYTSVIPSWQYSYQCSSSLLINYTPVLLYSFAISGILLPVTRVFYMQLSSTWIEKYVPEYMLCMMDNTINSYRRGLACPSSHNVGGTVNILSSSDLFTQENRFMEINDVGRTRSSPRTPLIK